MGVTVPGEGETTGGHQGNLMIRVIALEQTVQGLREQQQFYVRQREIDLQLSSIETTMKRLETSFDETKKHLADQSMLDRLDRELSEVKGTLSDVQKKQVEQDRQLQQLQIAGLKYVVITIIGFFITIIAGVLIAFVTHIL